MKKQGLSLSVSVPNRLAADAGAEMTAHRRASLRVAEPAKRMAQGYALSFLEVP